MAKRTKKIKARKKPAKKFKAKIKSKSKSGRPAKVKKILGRRIEVKTETAALPENDYGAVLDLDLVSAPTEIMAADIADFDFQAEEDAIPTENLAPLTNFAAGPETLEIEQADYDQRDEQEEFEQALEAGYRQPEPLDNLSVRQKNIIMYVAITCIMVIIIGFWFIGLRASLGQGFNNLNFQDPGALKVKQSLNDLSQGVSEIKTQLNNQQQATADFTSQVKQVIIEQQLKNDVTQKMKQQIENANTNANANSNLNLNSTNTNGN